MLLQFDTIPTHYTIHRNNYEVHNTVTNMQSCSIVSVLAEVEKYKR